MELIKSTDLYSSAFVTNFIIIIIAHGSVNTNQQDIDRVLAEYGISSVDKVYLPIHYTSNNTESICGKFYSNNDLNNFRSWIQLPIKLLNNL